MNAATCVRGATRRGGSGGSDVGSSPLGGPIKKPYDKERHENDYDERNLFHAFIVASEPIDLFVEQVKADQ